MREVKLCVGPCSRTKPLDDFHRNGGTRDGRASYCKDCTRDAVRQSRANADPKRKRRARNSQRVTLSRMRAREYGCIDTLTVDEWEGVLEAHNDKCAECGSKEYEMDHIVPLCLQGPNSVENVQPLCRPCNIAKCKVDGTAEQIGRSVKAYYKAAA